MMKLAELSSSSSRISAKAIAFSSTNRIFDNTQMCGQVVIFSTKGIYKKAVDDAIPLYSNGGQPVGYHAPTQEESQKQLQKATSALKKLAPLPKNINLKADTEELTAFAKAYQ